jgi:hypothetical protein
MAEARDRAAKRGVAIGAFDAITGGLAGRLLSGARGVTSTVARGTGELGIQAAGGAGVEAAAQLVTEGRITAPGEVLLEAAAEIVPGVGEVALNVPTLRERGPARPPPRGQPREFTGQTVRERTGTQRPPRPAVPGAPFERARPPVAPGVPPGVPETGVQAPPDEPVAVAPGGGPGGQTGFPGAAVPPPSTPPSGIRWLDLPIEVRQGVINFRRDGERGISPPSNIDDFLVSAGDPLATQGGTVETRWRDFVKRWAQATQGVHNLSVVEDPFTETGQIRKKFKAPQEPEAPPAATITAAPPPVGPTFPTNEPGAVPPRQPRRVPRTQRALEKLLDDMVRLRNAPGVSPQRRAEAQRLQQDALNRLEGLRQQIQQAEAEGLALPETVEFKLRTASGSETTFQLVSSVENIDTIMKRLGAKRAEEKFFSEQPARQASEGGGRATLGGQPSVESVKARIAAARDQGEEFSPQGRPALGAVEPGERHKGFVQDVFDPDKEPLPEKVRPLTRQDIIAPLMKDLGVPVFTGRIKGKRRLGFFVPRTEEVRVKRAADIEVTAHEIAHLLDKRFPEIRRQWMPASKANAAFREELRAVSYDKKKLFEGFAEFVRLWSTQAREAQERAPQFYQWFESFLGRNRHGPALRRAQQQMHAFFQQAALDRARSKVGQARNVNEVTDAALAERFRGRALRSDVGQPIRRAAHGRLARLGGQPATAWPQRVHPRLASIEHTAKHDRGVGELSDAELDRRVADALQHIEDAASGTSDLEDDGRESDTVH